LESEVVGNVTKHDFDKAVKKIGEYVQKFTGSKLSFSDTSTPDAFWASATISHAGIAIQVIVARLKGELSLDVLFSSPVVKIPNDNLVAFFRQLLAWNYGATDVAHYALDETQNTIFLMLRRPFEGFDYSEFKDAVETISRINISGIMLLRKSFSV
jgi:hypothetical protein